MKKLSFILILCWTCNLQAQNIINGSFENNTATNSMNDLSNAQYNATFLLSYSTSFGSLSATGYYGEIDALKSGNNYFPNYPSWAVNAYDGDWFIIPAGMGYSYINAFGNTVPGWDYQDAFSLALDDTLTTGSWYTLSFYAMYKHPPGGYPFYLPGRLSVGMSHYADSFGVLIDTTAYTDSVWTQHSVHFQASSNFAHITCRPVREQIGMNWPFVDYFVLKFDSTGTYVPVVASWNCNNNACTDPNDGSGTYSSLATCQTACVTNINEAAQQPKQLLKIVDILGKTASPKQKGILFYIYSDATVEKKVFVE